MLWISLKFAGAVATAVLVLYGAYIDGKRQKARNRKRDVGYDGRLSR
jgi:hypothetical protein